MTSKRNTFIKDRKGNLLFEGQRVKSWRVDECDSLNGGYWLFEIIKYYKSDWYLFCEGHEYSNDDEDDVPVLLENYCHEIELVD